MAGWLWAPKALHLTVNFFKLGVAIGMAGSLLRFAVGLQTVTELVQQLGHHAVTSLVALTIEFGGQVANALTGPAQRRLRIAARERLDQPLQVALESRGLWR